MYVDVYVHVYVYVNIYVDVYVHVRCIALKIARKAFKSLQSPSKSRKKCVTMQEYRRLYK